MPLFTNLKNEICQVLEPEVVKVVEAGWKELSENEEQIYRETLAKDPALTSAVAIEAARVKAGLYDVINSAEKVIANKVSSRTKKRIQTAINKASKGNKTNAGK